MREDFCCCWAGDGGGGTGHCCYMYINIGYTASPWKYVI